MTIRAIYHVTHADNLGNIVREGRLWSDAQRIDRGFATTNIGYSHIKARRMRRPVLVSVRGALGHYVPFNFCPRSVMLYVVSQGHDDYAGDQRPIVHLVASVQSVLATGRPWFFTDRHADLGYARHFESFYDLQEVDWSVMPLRQWGGDQEVKEKRQAEFLVHDWCPWSAIEVIGVMDREMAKVAEAAIVGARHEPRVEVHRNWYY